MFAEYDYSQFPIVNVYFSSTVENNEDFNNFTEEWYNLYRRGEPFKFIFHTEGVRNVPIKYSFMMAKFIKRLKKEKIQYLENSIIFVSSKLVKSLLGIIFFFQSPVAPVYIVYSDITDKEKYINDIRNNQIEKNVSIIKPYRK